MRRARRSGNAGADRLRRPKIRRRVDTFWPAVFWRGRSAGERASSRESRGAFAAREGNPAGQARDDDGGEIVNEPVKQIARRLSAPLLLDEACRLKNKIGQQVGQVNRQKGSKEDLHDSVQVSVLVRFRTTSKKCVRLTIQLP